MSERILIRNGTVLTLDDADTVHFGGDVLIEGDRIAAVGPTGSFDGAAVGRGGGGGGVEAPVTVLDATDKLVMPGLVDLHYHTAIAKGYSDHLPLWEYLDTCWYPIIRALDPEAAYWAALASYAESIKGGVTTVNDMYRQLEALSKAASEIGIRAVLSNDVADAEHNLDTLEDNHRAYTACHGAADGRVEVYIGIEWLPIASRELLRDTRALADQLGTGIHIHLNESLSEVENSKARFGLRPTEVAYETGILGRDTIAAHCVWLSDTEIALMRETNTQISHNPSSNAKLGNGIARLPEMLAAGLNVGLGHDAAECNNSRDMFEVMKFASLMHRASRVDSSLGQAPDVVRMATRNGAAALGHQTGQLVAGHKADVILVDLNNTMFTPRRANDVAHLYSHLVYSANGSCVDTTIIDGRVVMAGRELTLVDEDLILRESNKAFARVLARVEDAGAELAIPPTPSAAA
ncbi:amidohydrolase [Parafrankia sp. EUN1f]|uniref:amidohydrolase n=1 Tax=Parafrankia sp. EUN1f TaxID=102897 RepID=UPI0001C43F31|nr:amidohydrolase [Parafrankia sp. EUN1f]EFC83003.1 amidohydrolase [Parafrankia sp. EUN1f]